MKTKRMKKVISKVSSVIIIILLVLSLYSFISLRVLKKDLVSFFGYSMLEVVSGSMEPTISVGDLIIINTRDKNYQSDDIVTFYDEENSFVTHRIIKVNKKGVVTRGDANNSNDGEIDSLNIVGKYVLRIKGLGLIIAFLKKPIIILIVFVISSLVCYISNDYKGEELELKKREKKQFEEYLEDKEKFISKTKQNIKRRINRKNKKNLKAKKGKNKR